MYRNFFLSFLLVDKAEGTQGLSKLQLDRTHICKGRGEEKNRERCFLGCNSPREGPSLSLSGCRFFSNEHSLRAYNGPGLGEEGGTRSEPCSPRAHGPRTEMLIIPWITVLTSVTKKIHRPRGTQVTLIHNPEPKKKGYPGNRAWFHF